METTDLNTLTIDRLSIYKGNVIRGWTANDHLEGDKILYDHVRRVGLSVIPQVPQRYHIVNYLMEDCSVNNH